MKYIYIGRPSPDESIYGPSDEDLERIEEELEKYSD